MAKKPITLGSFTLFMVMCLFALCAAVYIVEVDLPNFSDPNWKMAGTHLILLIIFVSIAAYIELKYDFTKFTSYK